MQTAVDALTVREAGYVAKLSSVAVNRIIDSRRVPPNALLRRNRERMLTVPGVICLAIEKEAENAFTGLLRNRLRDQLRKNLNSLEPSSPAWQRELSVGANGVKGVVELAAIWNHIADRLGRIQRMHDVIVEDDNIQAGAPTFAGTRILVRPTAAALVEDDTPEALLKAYPRLTEEMLEFARLYNEVKPVRGRPKAKTGRLQPKSVRRITRPA